MKKLKLPHQKPAADPQAELTLSSESKPKSDSEPAAKVKPAKKPKAPKVKLSKLPSSRKLAQFALAEFRPDWKSYAKILLVVAVPVDIISMFPSISADSATSAYVSFASIVMNVALLWAIVRRQQTGKVPGVAKAYYEGSAPLLRYMITTILLVLMLVPMAIGASLYAISLTAADAFGVFGPEQIGVATISILFALPSLYLLVRYGLSPFAAVRDDLRPMAALKRSRIFTAGRFWPLASRLVGLVLFLVAVSIPATLLTIVFSLLKLGSFPTAFFEFASTLVALPLANLYLLGLYRELEQALQPKAQATSASDPKPDPEPESDKPEPEPKLDKQPEAAA